MGEIRETSSVRVMGVAESEINFSIQKLVLHISSIHNVKGVIGSVDSSPNSVHLRRGMNGIHSFLLTQNAGIRYPEKVELRCSVGGNHVVNFRVHPTRGQPCGKAEVHMSRTVTDYPGMSRDIPSSK